MIDPERTVVHLATQRDPERAARMDGPNWSDMIDDDHADAICPWRAVLCAGGCCFLLAAVAMTLLAKAAGLF